MCEPTKTLLETLACTNPDCQTHAKPGIGNLTVRKTYGQDRILYLRCKPAALNSVLDPKTHPTDGIAERKNTALWDTKIIETQAALIGDCLANKNSLKAAIRISKVNKSTVKPGSAFMPKKFMKNLCRT